MIQREMDPILIDTHAHLYDGRFRNDLDDVVQRAQDVGVTTILLPAVDLQSVYHSLDLCARFQGVFAMAGIHPTHVRDAKEQDLIEITQLCNEPKIIAVGECGLDYYWDKYFDERQPDFFAQQIRLSSETNLPIVLHLRDKQHRDQAHRDAIEILQRELPARTKASYRGIFHCFTGPDWLPEVAEKLGFLIGVGGAVTFKNAGVAEMIQKVPLHQIVLETDAPYMTPVPHRGQRNEPAWTKFVAEKIAAVHQSTVAEVAEITSANARQLFGLH